MSISAFLKIFSHVHICATLLIDILAREEAVDMPVTFVQACLTFCEGYLEHEFQNLCTKLETKLDTKFLCSLELLISKDYRIHCSHLH